MRMWVMLINRLPVNWMPLISSLPVIAEPHIMYKFIDGVMSTRICREWLTLRDDTCNNNPIARWAADICYTEPELRFVWKDICKCSLNIGNPLIKDFHLLFINRAFQLNSVISKYRPEVSPFCSFGCQESETHLHLFYACPKVKTLWRKIKCFYQEFVNDDYLILNEIKCLLSDFKDKLLIVISIVVKRRIFLCRLNNFALVFSLFLEDIRCERNVQRLKAKGHKQREHIFHALWGPLAMDDRFDTQLQREILVNQIV